MGDEMCLLTRDAFQFLCLSPALLEIKEQEPCLESQGVHPAAQAVDLSEQLAAAIGAGIDAGKAGLIEPKGRQAASLCADDMIRAFQQQHRGVLQGLLRWLECQPSFNPKTLSGVDRWKIEIL